MAIAGRNAGKPRATMVRATEKTRSIIKRYAEMEGRSQVELLEEAVETWERRKLLDDMVRGYKAIQDDPEAHAQFEAECALYENAVADGLDEE